MPNTFVDITAVMKKKLEAMAVMAAQSYLINYYTELAARRGNQDVKYAEAHQRMLPRAVDGL